MYKRLLYKKIILILASILAVIGILYFSITVISNQNVQKQASAMQQTPVEQQKQQEETKQIVAEQKAKEAQMSIDESIRLQSTKYLILEAKSAISKIMPKTQISEFKAGFNMPENTLHVYSDHTLKQEITTGYVGTGMTLKYDTTGETFDLSVIGDFNKDGQMSQIELNLIIKHVLELEGYKLTDLKAMSADISDDEKIDQIDITSIIRYIVYNRLDKPEIKRPSEPIIEITKGSIGEGSNYNTNVEVSIKENTEQDTQIAKTIYKITGSKQQEETEIIQEEGQTQKQKVITLSDGEYQISACSISKNGAKSKIVTKTVKVNKPENVATVEAKTGLTYTGMAQELITIANTEQVEIYYSTTTPLNKDNYKTQGNKTIPTAINAGEHKVYYYSPENDNYKASKENQNVTVEIDKKQVQVQWGNKEFTYNASEQKPTATVESGITGETINLEVIGGRVNAGNNYTATAVIESVTGGQANKYNYELTQETTTFSIAKTENLATIEAKENLIYTGTLQQLVTEINTQEQVEIYYSTTTALNKDNYQTNGSKTIPTATDAGEYTIYYYSPEGENHNSNEEEQYVTSEIHKKEIQVQWENTSFTYDGASHVPTATVASGITEETINLIVSGEQTNAGSNYIATAEIESITGGQENKNNYRLTEETTTFTINKTNSAIPTLTDVTATYDGLDHYIAVSGGNGGTIYYRTNTNNIDTGWTEWTETKPGLTNVGTIYVQAYVKGDSNHNDTIATNSAKIQINKRTLTVTAEAKSKIYGEENPELTYTYSGQVNGETPAFNGILECSATATSAVGTYDITIGTLALKDNGAFLASNYNISYTKASLTITAKNETNFTISLGTTSYTYDGTAKTPTVTVKDGSTTLTENTHYTVAYSNNTNAGTATVTVTGIGNYTGSKNKSFEILPKPVSDSYHDYEVEYNGTNGIYAWGIMDRGGEGVEFIEGGGDGYYFSVGRYSFEYSLEPNYIWDDGTYENKLHYLTIVPAIVEEPSSPSEKTYNGELQECGITTPENAHVVTSSSTTEATNAGTYTVEYALDDSSGYEWSDGTTANKSITWTINKITLTVTAGSASKTYDGTALTSTSSGSVTSGSLVSGHTMTITNTGTITNAGSTENTLSTVIIKRGTTDVTANYSITKVNGTLTVYQANSSNPTLTDVTTTYDGQAHDITVSGGNGGTIYYRTNTNNTDIGWTEWTETKPSLTNAGIIYVQAYVEGDENHSDTSPTSSAQIQINKRTLTVTAEAKTKKQGKTNPTLTYKYSGQISGETPGFTGSLATTANNDSAVGNYDITQGTLALANNGTFIANNYNMSYVGAILTIEENEYYKVGSSTYSNLYNAVQAVWSGGTIEVLESNNDTSSVTISKKVKLDLNKYTVTMSNPITISSTGNLTIGTVEDEDRNGILRNNDGTCIINKGTLSMNGANIEGKTGIYLANKSAAYINGGDVTGTQYGISIETPTLENFATLYVGYPGDNGYYPPVITGNSRGIAVVNQSGAEVSDEGDSYKFAFQYRNGTILSSSKETYKTAATYTAGYVPQTVFNGSKYVTSLTEINVAGMTEDQKYAIGTTTYQTLAAATEAVKPGQTIIALQDSEETSTATIDISGSSTNKEIKLNLNGKTITMTNKSGIFLETDNALRIVGDGKINNSLCSYIILNRGIELNINLSANGTIDATLSAISSGISTNTIINSLGTIKGKDVIENEGGNVELKDGIIEAKGGSNSVDGIACVPNSGGTVRISGGKIKVYSQGCGVVLTEGTVEMTGGTIELYDRYATGISCGTTSTVKLLGGKITYPEDGADYSSYETCGVSSSMGDVTIDGGMYIEANYPINFNGGDIIIKKCHIIGNKTPRYEGDIAAAIYANGSHIEIHDGAYIKGEYMGMLLSDCSGHIYGGTIIGCSGTAIYTKRINTSRYIEIGDSTGTYNTLPIIETHSEDAVQSGYKYCYINSGIFRYVTELSSSESNISINSNSTIETTGPTSYMHDCPNKTGTVNLYEKRITIK